MMWLSIDTVLNGMDWYVKLRYHISWWVAENIRYHDLDHYEDWF
jgi:hypothetical protein